MKRVLLTGATGFVGANLTRYFLKQGHQIHIFVRSEYTSWRIEDIKSEIHLHVIDMLDTEKLEALVNKIRPEWIFHLAVYGAYSWQNDLNQMIQTNIISTVNLLNSCLKVGFEVFVNTGSSSEYGYKSFAPNEQTWIDPNSYYSWSKATSTHFCRYTAFSQNMRIPTLRLYSVYGKYEAPNRFLPKLIFSLRKQELPQLATPSIARDYVYIDDVVQAYQLVAEQKKQEFGAIYNVGTGVQTTLDEVVAIAKDVFHSSVEPHWGSFPDRQWDTNVWVADNHAIKSTLGWSPKYDFEAGFREMVEWFDRNGELLNVYGGYE